MAPPEPRQERICNVGTPVVLLALKLAFDMTGEHQMLPAIIKNTSAAVSTSGQRVGQIENDS